MKGSIWAVAQTGVPVAAILLAATALAEPDDSGDPNAAHGEYVARAAGCMSCHQEDLSGGYRVETPMGTIVASNISPSQDYGIGGYSRDDLANVLRRGVAPDRRLYPAMPYASYRGMTDADIDALYLWLMEQDAVDEAPENETDLPFPFNIRTGVIAWNWLYLDDRDLPDMMIRCWRVAHIWLIIWGIAANAIPRVTISLPCRMICILRAR